MPLPPELARPQCHTRGSRPGRRPAGLVLPHELSKAHGRVRGGQAEAPACHSANAPPRPGAQHALTTAWLFVCRPPQAPEMREQVTEELIRDTIGALPTQPQAISHLVGPFIQLSKVRL